MKYALQPQDRAGSRETNRLKVPRIHATFNPQPMRVPSAYSSDRSIDSTFNATCPSPLRSFVVMMHCNYQTKEKDKAAKGG
jgi:hypothetical protein